MIGRRPLKEIYYSFCTHYRIFSFFNKVPRTDLLTEGRTTTATASFLSASIGFSRRVAHEDIQ